MKKKPVLLRLFGYLKGWWGLGFFFGLGTSASQSFLTTLVVALGLKNMTDAILSGAMSVLLSATLKVLLAFIGIYAILPFVWYLFYRASQEIHRNLLYDLYEHIQLLPIRYMENNHSGDLISRITNDTEPLRDVCGEHMKGIVQLSIAGVGNAITIFILDGRLGIGAISIGLVTLLSNIIFAKPLRRVGKQNQEALSDTTQRLSDIIAGRKVMKIFGLEKTAMGKFILANERALAASLKRVRLSTVNRTITHFVHSAAESGFIAVGAIFVIQGSLTFGTLLATLAMIHRIIWMFRGFGQYATRIQRILAGADRVFDLLDEPAESIIPPPTALWTWRKEHRRKNGPPAPVDNFAAPQARTPDIPAETPAVEIHKLGFAYDPEMPVIQDLSLVISQ
ncbi:MAG: ABC transporter ATP-binding protein, partial [Spirochaetales bacterium]|nr:ABC transporter ATP-binding protein [Spirochaetales bacterium]